MQMNGRLEMGDINALLKARSLETIGKAQQYIDSEVLRLSAPKLPFLSGMLEISGRRHTVIGSGLVQYDTPYARFLYYGKVMVGSRTGSAWARHNEIKVLTTTNLKYNGAPTRGAFWFERMKQESKDSILNGVKRIAGAR